MASLQKDVADQGDGTVDKPNSVKAVEHYNRGNILGKRGGDKAGAEAAYRAATVADPLHANAHSNLGNLLGDRGDKAGAEAAFRAAIAADSTHTVAHNNLGNLLGDRGDKAGAEAAYRGAIAADQTHANAHYNLGNILYEDGKTADAEAAYRAAIAADPQHGPAHGNLGVLLHKEGDLSGAREQYLAALIANQKDEGARWNLGNVSPAAELRNRQRAELAAAAATEGRARAWAARVKRRKGAERARAARVKAEEEDEDKKEWKRFRADLQKEKEAEGFSGTMEVKRPFIFRDWWKTLHGKLAPAAAGGGIELRLFKEEGGVLVPPPFLVGSATVSPPRRDLKRFRANRVDLHSDAVGGDKPLLLSVSLETREALADLLEVLNKGDVFVAGLDHAWSRAPRDHASSVGGRKHSRRKHSRRKSRRLGHKSRRLGHKSKRRRSTRHRHKNQLRYI